MFPYHPGNNFADPRASFVSKAIPASEILHCYEKQRTQVRGVPWGAPSILSMRDLSDYEEAEIVRKKIEASTVAIVTGNDDDEEGIAPRVVDADGNVIEKFEPGLIAYARGGKDVRFNAPATIGGYAEYKQAMLRTISAGYRIPYELISGDLSQVNFSSIRAGLVEFRRFVKTVQWHIFIPMFLEPIWAWFCEAAYLAGEIDSPIVPVEWAPPKFDFVSPVDDAQAEQIALRNGTRTWQEIVAEHGRNPDDVLDEIAAWNARMDDLGITLDSDPRRTSVKGVQQKDQESTGGHPASLTQPN
jgi:lambda family phage portal protein